MSLGNRKISLRLLVDRERNKAVFAEAHGDFVDVLFGFLTLPMGTVARLLEKQQSPSQEPPVNIGCFSNLYRGVRNLGVENFRTAACKQMLLHPRSTKEDLCRKLIFDIDETEVKYYICSNIDCNKRRGALFSNYVSTKCRCGQLLDVKMKFAEKERSVYGGDGGGFVSRKSVFFVTDDLQVIESSFGGLVGFLGSLGIEDVNSLEEMTLNVGFQEMWKLFTSSFTSKSALTDSFLGNRNPVCVRAILNSEFRTLPEIRPEIFAERNDSLTLKVLLRKSECKIFYAESNEDFADFILAFLAIPLESVCQLIGGADMFSGCIGNLYRSSLGLGITAAGCVLPPHYCYKKQQLLDIVTQDSCYCYIYGDDDIRNCSLFSTTQGSSGHSRSVRASLADPKSPDGGSESTAGLLSKTSKFLISDDLITLKPKDSIISVLQELKISASDLEEQEIQIGRAEAVSILRAAMLTSSALTNGLSGFLLKKPKKET